MAKKTSFWDFAVWIGSAIAGFVLIRKVAAKSSTVAGIENWNPFKKKAEKRLDRRGERKKPAAADDPGAIAPGGKETSSPAAGTPEKAITPAENPFAASPGDPAAGGSMDDMTEADIDRELGIDGDPVETDDAGEVEGYDDDGDPDEGEVE